LSQDADVGLTDVWRNTPLHCVTFELLTVAEVAERTYCTNTDQQTSVCNDIKYCGLVHITACDSI